MNPALHFDKLQTAQFLNAFLGRHASKLGGQYFQFVHIGEKKQITALSCNADSPRLLERVLKWHEQMGGIYISMGLRTEIFDNDRGLEEDMSGLVALFCEVDVYGPGWHKASQNLPLTKEVAEDLVRIAFPNHPPSMIVDSGGGIYAYWLLKDPWIFADASERDHAKAVLVGIFHTLATVVRAEGFHLDNVGELARILRLPGSFNFKVKDDVRPAVVRMLADDLRYDPSQFAEFVAASCGVARRCSLPFRLDSWAFASVTTCDS